MPPYVANGLLGGCFDQHGFQSRPATGTPEGRTHLGYSDHYHRAALGRHYRFGLLTIEGAFARGAPEMIVVMPDSKTVHNGSMYSSSVTVGDFEQFIARDVVSSIDARYRTIPKRTSRGLAGHSMGGYGASRIGMKQADVFGSLYIMSPCCLAPRGAGPANRQMEKMLEAVKTPADSAALSFGPRAQLATAAAWSPRCAKNAAATCTARIARMP